MSPQTEALGANQIEAPRAEADGVWGDPVSIETGDETCVLNLLGTIGWEVSAADVATAISKAGGKPIHARIFSYGGDAMQGLAIYQLLSAYTGGVTTEVLGIAASAGSVIAMAGSKRIVPKNAALMVHNAWGITMGDADAHRKAAVELEGVTYAYAQTYANATGRLIEEIQPFLTDEKWLYGEEAVAELFATEVGDEMPSMALCPVIAAERFARIPENLRNLVQAKCAEQAKPVSASKPIPRLSIEQPAVGGHENAAPAMTATSPASATESKTDWDLAAAERNRVQAIRGLCRAHKMPESVQDEFIDNGVSVVDAQAAVLAKLQAGEIPAAALIQRGGIADAGAGNIGMSAKDVARYDVMNALRYLADKSPENRERAGFELEISAQCEKSHERSANGILIPHEVLSTVYRASQTVGSFGAGGALVETVRTGSFIDFIYKRAALAGAGVTILQGLVGNVEIGKQTGSSSYFFVGENVPVTASALGFGSVNMSPKTIGVRVPVSRRALIQTTPDMGTLVTNDMFRRLALGVDHSSLYGTGSSATVQGLKNIAGIGGVTLGGGASLVYPANLGGGTHDTGDWADYVGLEGEISADDLDVASMRYLLNSKTRQGCKITLRASASGSDYIFTDAGTIAGYQTTVSNQIEQNDVFLGDWSQMIMGFWSSLDVIVDQYTQSASGQVIYTVFQDFDTAVRYPEAFALGS